MRRTDEEFKSELIKRCDDYKCRQKKKHKRIIALCVPLLCVAAVCAVVIPAVASDKLSENLSAAGSSEIYIAYEEGADYAGSYESEAENKDEYSQDIAPLIEDDSTTNENTVAYDTALGEVISLEVAKLTAEEYTQIDESSGVVSKTVYPPVKITDEQTINKICSFLAELEFSPVTCGTGITASDESYYIEILFADGTVEIYNYYYGIEIYRSNDSESAAANEEEMQQLNALIYQLLNKEE